MNSRELNGCWPVAGECVISDMETSVSHPWPEDISRDHDYGEHTRIIHSNADASTQTGFSMTDIDNLQQKAKQLDDPDTLLRDLFIAKVTKSDSSVQQYTGIPSKRILDGTFDILNKSSPELKYWGGQNSSTPKAYQTDPYTRKTGPKRKLSRYQEFLLTLIRLRMTLTNFVLADLFAVSSSRVSQIFTTWINYMAIIFSPLIKWPSQEVIKKFRPRSFKLKFPNVTSIIDCTEFFIMRPWNPTAQSQTFSTYKQHNTFKALVSISPSGAITFVSNLWGGNVSDRHITKECGFLDIVRPGDEIMADRGFVIRDLLLKKRAKLIIPPFTRKCAWGKGKHLSASDIIKTKNIAHFRIHVERAIGRLKTFQILSNTMPLNLKHVANQILTVCAFLCNLQKPLVKK
ncbi:uncharacterized protein LOC134239316 [Saccostrea cucullata]|uniref:uncharacterized protein LOC134239316 n=1 Tax=Saccostrea cuccullata TaxID=36930 RepID=UPI002ED64A3A